MISAMPAVKPTVTGNGTNWITVPSRARPIPINSTPAINVASASPSTPWRCTTP